jgi:hypothetical protein
MLKEKFVNGKIILSLILAVMLTTGYFTPDLLAQSPENGEPINPSVVPGQELVEIEVQDIASRDVEEQSVTLFKRYSAEVFVSYDDASTYDYGGGGCVSRTGGDPWYDHDLQLPDGAEIDFVRIYFIDNDPVNDANAWVFTFDGTGNSTQIALAQSSGTPGTSSAGSGFFSHTVNNINEALAIRLGYEGATTPDLKICGVRLRYQYSVATLFLPTILKDLGNP